VAMTIVICPKSFASDSKANDNPPIFSIPEKAAVQDGHHENTPRCVPLRNVGIAEPARDYYASCEEDGSPKTPLNGQRRKMKGS
jgi:hypothetical protein